MKDRCLGQRIWSRGQKTRGRGQKDSIWHIMVKRATGSDLPSPTGALWSLANTWSL